jgi:hypothetical protein
MRIRSRVVVNVFNLTNIELRRRLPFSRTELIAPIRDVEYQKHQSFITQLFTNDPELLLRDCFG